MRRPTWPVSLLWGVCLVLVSDCAAQPAAVVQSKYRDPARFEKDIQAFEAEVARRPPEPGAILCVGSSTMRLWHAEIHEDLAPLTVIARGFGGSTMFDLLHFADRIVLPYKPRAIVVYEGDNDVWLGVGAEEIRDTFRAFVQKVHRELPDTRIYFLAIKPSHARHSKWPVMQQANQLIADECRRDERLHYVNIVPVLMDQHGQVRRELFQEDDLHLNRAGYEQLRGVVRGALEKLE